MHIFQIIMFCGLQRLINLYKLLTLQYHAVKINRPLLALLLPTILGNLN